MARPTFAVADMRVSRGGKPCECGINYPLCPICHDTHDELRRCGACHHYRTLDRFDEGNQVCRGCLRKRRDYKDRIAAGEHVPEKRAPHSKWCKLCFGMSHRVAGPVCSGCGLLYFPDVVIGDAWKRKPSAWALLMSGGESE